MRKTATKAAPKKSARPAAASAAEPQKPTRIEITDQIRQIVAGASSKIEAIKAVRSVTGGLLEAKDLVDQVLESEQPAAAMAPHTPAEAVQAVTDQEKHCNEDWVSTTPPDPEPRLKDEGYFLTMHAEALHPGQEVEITRQEFIELKQRLAEMRGLVNVRTITLRKQDPMSQAWYNEYFGKTIDLGTVELSKTLEFIEQLNKHGFQGEVHDELIDPLAPIEWEGRLLKAFAEFMRDANPPEKRFLALLLEDRLENPGDHDISENFLEGAPFRKLKEITSGSDAAEQEAASCE